MSFLFAFLLVVIVLIMLAAVAQRRQPAAHHAALGTARRQLLMLAPRLPLALIAATCIAQLLPREHIVTWIGTDSGLSGVLIGAVVGVLLPGGPILAFPLAIALFHAGAGPAALVSLITAWSLIAIHRALVFEVPFLGWRQTAWRHALSTPLPWVAGALVLAAGLMGLEP